jgi:FkbM family methyltransferase
MKALNQFGRFLFSRLPPYNPRLYHLCRRYVSRYDAENNSNIQTNGELRFMQQTLVNCQTVFDVGANVGNWAALALQINPKLTIHCFEPSYATYQRLLAQAFPPSVICNNFGLSSATGERLLYVFENGAGINSLYRREGLEDCRGLAPQELVETVRLDTLDNYCKELDIQAIDYLKTDVEGHELEVFKGATEMLEAGRVRIVQFEYGGCNIDARVLLKDIFRFFGKFDYTLCKLYPEGLRQVAHYDQRLENFQYQNWIAIKHGVEELVHLV